MCLKGGAGSLIPNNIAKIPSSESGNCLRDASSGNYSGLINFKPRDFVGRLNA